MLKGYNPGSGSGAKPLQIVYYLAPLHLVRNSTMRLDHVPDVTSHDQPADTVQRPGSRLGSTFVEGGICPSY